MSTTEIVFLAVLLIVVAFLLLRARQRSVAAQVAKDQYWQQQVDDQTAKFEDLWNSVSKVALAPWGRRYEVRLADWGPDFTGYDGELPRWRWTIVDAEQPYRVALGAQAMDIGTNEIPFMLGNAFTPLDAMRDALKWIEEHESPPYSVVVAAMEPTLRWRG